MRHERSASQPRVGRVLAVVAVLLAVTMLAPRAHADETWEPVVNEIVQTLEQISDQHATNDLTGVETSIRRAYYETYQVSGLEDQIKHRLGRDRADDFRESLLEIRQLARDGADQPQVDAAVGQSIDLLRADVAELGTTAAISNRWTIVADEIADTASAAVTHYEAGHVDAAYQSATDAYLAHYEADGLERATIAYIGNSRVSAVEAQFRDLRASIRAGVPVAEVSAIADELSSMVREDAAQLDQFGSEDGGLGWAGFLASFLILLREGAEALLVVAAVVTYVLKAGRREQLKHVGFAVAAALLVSVALAFLLNSITASAAAGFGQEVVEGVTGALAVIMLIYVSGWIMGKASGGSMLSRDLSDPSSAAGTWTLASVVFLAVVREGAETILFFAPITAAATTANDHLMIWLGSGAAVVILAILFVLVWRFGIRLPMRPFFKWTSVLLAVLAVTIAGGAAKEFQDATLLGSTSLPGVPEISVLGLYPTVETVVTQLVVIVIVVAFNLHNHRKSRPPAAPAETSGSSPEEAPAISGEPQSERIPQ